MTATPGTTDAPLYRRVERLVPRLAQRMLDRFVAEIPLYSLLPREQLDGEILAITDHNLRLFFAALRQGRSLTEVELSEIRTSAARRAEERVPLEAVLAAYHVGGRIGWDALVEGAEPDDSAALVAAAGRVLAYVQQVTGEVAAAYLEERQSIYGEERDAVRALASALLAGEPADALAARAGVPLAPAYVVLAVRIGRHVDEGDQGVGGAVAARRKLRRVLHRLEAGCGPVLSLLDPNGGSVLLPCAADTVGDLDAGLGPMVDDLSEAAGADVVVAHAVASDVTGLRSAAEQAVAVLGIVTETGRPPGAYRLADVLLDYQLRVPSPALPALAELLTPLDRNPDLFATLQVYVGNDLDRRRTAAQLHVHPNTLDYRLRRIVELTGLDPSTSTGLQLLGAALAARRRRDAHTPPAPTTES